MKVLKDVKVTSKSQVIATLDIEQFDSLEEAVSRLGSSEKALELINTQYKTNLMNAKRQAANPKKTRDQLQAELFSDPNFFSSMQAAGVFGDQAKTAEFLKTAIDNLKAKYEAASPKVEDTEEEGSED